MLVATSASCSSAVLTTPRCLLSSPGQRVGMLLRLLGSASLNGLVDPAYYALAVAVPASRGVPPLHNHTSQKAAFSRATTTDCSPRTLTLLAQAVRPLRLLSSNSPAAGVYNSFMTKIFSVATLKA